MTPPKQLILFPFRRIKHLHRIANFDPITKTGDCPTCGRVEVRIRKKGTYTAYQCRIKDRADRKLARQRHPDRFAVRWKRGNAKWKAKPDSAERERAYAKRWRQKNPRKNLATVVRKRAAKLQRTPPWADLKAITRFYEQCPRGYEVDHIIPLNGKNVSGLHVLNNLQYLTEAENNRKNNHFEPYVESFEV